MAFPLTEMVHQRGRSQPHDPWLFWPRGLDWSFLTWGQASARLEEERRGLAAAAGGRRVAFPWRARGEDWLLDLALCEAGAVAVPVEAEDAAVVATARARGGAVLTEAGRCCFTSRPPQAAASGGGWAGACGGIERWEDGRLSRAVDRLADGLGPAVGRDIALLHGSPERIAVRIVLTWATLSGAAVVLEPSEERLLATCRWARPTVLLANAGTAAELRRRMEAAARRRLSARRLRRLRGRLRGLVLAREEMGTVEEAGVWKDLGVAVVGA